MRQVRWFSVAVLIPSLVLVAFTAGCGDKDKDKAKAADNHQKGCHEAEKSRAIGK
jgi:hypothetical protein